jgi:hypothetical protein
MKRKLLSLLVLLMTAATGAWAETITWDDSNVFNRENKGGSSDISSDKVIL